MGMSAPDVLGLGDVVESLSDILKLLTLNGTLAAVQNTLGESSSG
jgi:hypothetical protein